MVKGISLGMAGDQINAKNLLQIGSRQRYTMTPSASLTLKLRFHPITMSQKVHFQIKSGLVAETFVIIHKGMLTGQNYRTRTGPDSQEAWLSRDMPPHSLDPSPRFLNLNLNHLIQGNLLPLNKTGNVQTATCGM